MLVIQMISTQIKYRELLVEGIAKEKGGGNGWELKNRSPE